MKPKFHFLQKRCHEDNGIMPWNNYQPLNLSVIFYHSFPSSSALFFCISYRVSGIGKVDKMKHFLLLDVEGKEMVRNRWKCEIKGKQAVVFSKYRDATLILRFEDETTAFRWTRHCFIYFFNFAVFLST